MQHLQNDMLACGKDGLPSSFEYDGEVYTRELVFKHDFFACTGRYKGLRTDRQVVLKINRVRSFLGLPLGWLGRYLRNREVKFFNLLKDIEATPLLIGKFGRNGLIYKYIEGKSLDEKPTLSDHFFADLEKLIAQLHSKNICYIDLNKKGNILIGSDQRPYLIDFQISLLINSRWLAFVKNAMQKEDLYHLLKHKRKFRPDLLTSDEKARSKQKSNLIKIHRFICNPCRKIRRWLLGKLYQANILTLQISDFRTPENNPARFIKSESS